MLKHNEVNPLAVFGLRKVDHCPPHFITIKFNVTGTDKGILDWVYEHLQGRFYYGDYYFIEDGKSGVQMCKCAAFEEPGEASYFSLLLDTFNKKAEW